MHYCFNKFFYLNMESNYRPNGLTSAPSWHETAILWFNPLLFYFPYLAVSLWKLENVLKTQELFRPPNQSYGSIDFTLT